MNKKINSQRLFFVCAIMGLVVLFLYTLRSVLLPFVVGILLAYFLNPIVGKFSKNKNYRTLVTILVMFILLMILIPGIAFLCGATLGQIADFAKKLPEYSDLFVKRVMPIIANLQEHFPELSVDGIEDMLKENAINTLNIALKILKGIISNGFEFINLISLLLISPVVAFYMLRDWPIFTQKLIELIPPKHKKDLLKGIEEVNRIISGYLRGQFLVCCSLGTYYSLGLWLVNLHFGIMVGFLAGMISFIPYVGSISGFLMAIVLVVTQYGTWAKTVAVIVVFAIGQFVEGNFLTPKLVGENIGLHPVWVMFALLAGGTLLGLLGMIIAVPCAAITGVLIRYLIKNYKNSPLYLGK